MSTRDELAGVLADTINKNFKDGVDVYDFMKTYNRRISTGKIDTDIVEMLRGKSQAARVVFSKTGGDILSIMDTAANTSQFESKQDFQNNFPPDLASVFTGPLLDGLIMDGIKKMKDPATGAMMIWGLSESEFKEEIKSKLAVKTWRQYDPTKNPSVFGWMTQKRKQGTFMMSIMDNTKNEFQNYNYFNNSYDACKNVDAIVIGTEWNEFRALNFDEIGNIVKKRKIFDLRNIYNQIELEKKDFEYYATGK